MIRVLHYIPGYLVGGIESLYNNWYKYIDKEQFTFELLIRTTEEAAPLQWYKEQGGVYYRLPCTSITKIVNFGKGMKQFFSEHHDYDILHVHVSDPYVMRYAKQYGIKKIIIHSHTSRSRESILAKINWVNEQVGMHIYADKAVAVSNVAARWKFHSLRFKGKDVIILKNGIEVEKYRFDAKIRQGIRKELKIKDGQYVVGFVGRLTTPKNVFRMINIWKNVVSKVNDAILLIVGDGPDRDEAEKLANKLHLNDYVRFLGVRLDVNELMMAFDSFCMPSLYEGLPVTFVEAQTSGLPCVVSDVVAQEAFWGNNVKKINLESDDSIWADEIINFNQTMRCVDAYEIAKNAGFDTKDTVMKLQNVYKDLVDEI